MTTFVGFTVFVVNAINLINHFFNLFSIFLVSNTEASSSRNDEFHLPAMPSGDWEMNVFLNELADELTGGDLKTMKHFLTGMF